jgi:hypothetical protein
MLGTPKNKRDASISCGTISDEERASPMYKHIKRLVTPIFEDSLKEASKNHMVVGSARSDQIKIAFVQPHNYRSYFNYSRVSSLLEGLKDGSGFINTEGRSTEGGSVGKVYYKKVNHGKEISFPDFLDCRIVVKKSSIEIINKVDHKRWFSVRMHKDLIEKDMVGIAKGKDAQTLSVLKNFVFFIGGSSDFILRNTIIESKVKGEDSISRIPIDMHFHNEVAKTVYAEKNDPVKNVEFKSMGLASAYLVNRCREDFIDDKFESLRKEIMTSKSNSLVSPLESIKLSVVCFPDDVFRLADRILSLSIADKDSLTEWFFVEFGGAHA